MASWPTFRPLAGQKSAKFSSSADVGGSIFFVGIAWLLPAFFTGPLEMNLAAPWLILLICVVPIFTCLTRSLKKQSILIAPSCILPPQHDFHGRNILAPVAASLANGAGLSRLGIRALKENLIKLASPTLQIDRIHGNIAGSVIHIDHFGNLTANIHQRDLAGLTADPASIQIFHKPQQMTGLARSYASRPNGQVLALIGSCGYLELAVANGHAARILGAEVDDPCG